MRNLPPQSSGAPASIETIDGLAAILPRFDGVILDLWGCLHDGIRVYEPALDCLRHLRRSGRRIAIMSNAPRRRDAVAARIAELGLVPDLYDDLIASGEETWLALRSRSIAAVTGATAVLAIMTDRDSAILEGLDLVRTDDPTRADFLLAVGIDGPQVTVGDFEPMLRIAVDRRLPMVCANPDLLVHRGSVAEICAGAIAQRYEELGGQVAWFGKPHPGIYRRALGNFALPAEKVLCVGDSLRTDVAGGAGIGAGTLFIGGGIHHAEVLTGAGLANDRLDALCQKMGITPDFAMAYLAW